MELFQVLSVPHQKSHSNGLAVAGEASRGFTNLIASFLELHYYQVNFYLLYLTLQFLEYHILFLVRLFLKIHVIFERLWKVQSGRFHESHHVDLTVTVILLFFLDSKLLMVSGFPCYICQLVVITFLLFKFWGLPWPYPVYVQTSPLPRL